MMPGQRLTPEQIKMIYEMRAEGHTAMHVARTVGCSEYSVRLRVPGWIGKVPVAPLRKAFLESGISAAELARRLGWMYTRPNRRRHHQGDAEIEADTARVKRTLGIIPTLSRGHYSRRQLVDAETVMLMAEAIGVGWWEVLPDEEPASRVAA